MWHGTEGSGNDHLGFSNPVCWNTSVRLIMLKTCCIWKIKKKRIKKKCCILKCQPTAWLLWREGMSGSEAAVIHHFHALSERTITMFCTTLLLKCKYTDLLTWWQIWKQMYMSLTAPGQAHEAVRRWRWVYVTLLGKETKFGSFSLRC